MSSVELEEDIAVAPDKPGGQHDPAPSDEEHTEVVEPEAGDELPSKVAAAAAEAAILASQSVEINYTERVHPEAEVVAFHDHFTLQIPSSVIRYRDGHSAARVLESNDAQFVLEETYDEAEDKRSVSIRRIHDTSEGVRALRLMYAIVTAFWTGFLFIFCLQLLLFLFLDLAIQSGATSKQGPNYGKAIGTWTMRTFFLIYDEGGSITGSSLFLSF
jgi:hypothetical protein